MVTSLIYSSPFSPFPAFPPLIAFIESSIGTLLIQKLFFQKNGLHKNYGGNLKYHLA